MIHPPFRVAHPKMYQPTFTGPRAYVAASIMREVHPDLVMEPEDNLVDIAHARQSNRTKAAVNMIEASRHFNFLQQLPTHRPNSGKFFDPTRTLLECDLSLGASAIL